MTNRFISFLDKVGHDFKRGLDPTLKIAATAGEVAVSILAPGLGPLFASTVTAVITAEQNAAAIGQQSGTGPQKLASVVQLMGGLISQALADMGKPNDIASVQNYVSAVVTVLKAVPTNAFDASAPTLPAVVQAASSTQQPTVIAVVPDKITADKPATVAPIQELLQPK